MNKRIKELAEQAGGEFYTGFAGSPNSVKFVEQDFEKFAELIIRECFDQIHKQSRGPCGDEHGEWYENVVLEHFGVK
jgi:hypothetical protein